MMRSYNCCIYISILSCAGSVWGATATFAPVGASHVPRGDPIAFTVVVSASAGGFNTADIVIGSNTVTDISLAYSPAWTAGFSNVTPISYDNGFFQQDLFAGGNNPASVGTSLSLGTVTVDTAGMTFGTHSLTIDQTIDGISSLGMNGTPEPLAGSISFQVTPPVPAASTWGLISLGLGIAILGTWVLKTKDAFETC